MGILLLSYHKISGSKIKIIIIDRFFLGGPICCQTILLITFSMLFILLIIFRLIVNLRSILRIEDLVHKFLCGFFEFLNECGVLIFKIVVVIVCFQIKLVLVIILFMFLSKWHIVFIILQTLPIIFIFYKSQQHLNLNQTIKAFKH